MGGELLRLRERCRFVHGKPRQPLRVATGTGQFLNTLVPVVALKQSCLVSAPVHVGSMGTPEHVPFGLAGTFKLEQLGQAGVEGIGDSGQFPCLDVSLASFQFGDDLVRTKPDGLTDRVAIGP